jgi:hypothetical protein
MGFRLFDPSVHEVFDYAREFLGVVADVVAFASEVTFDDAAAFLEQRLDIADFHGELVFFFGVYGREL